MVAQADPAAPAESENPGRLGLLLSAAMFVLVVDTSLMNVSISAVVEDLGTTVSGVQSAIALEALVSAAFILISSKLGDLFGRKLAYTLGLLGYAVGATAMVLAQDLRTVIIFWAIVGGLGASLLLPAMQSLIHGNFEGVAQRRVYAMVGAAAAIAAAIGPLVGGFITTVLVLAPRVCAGGGRHRRRAVRAGAGQGREVHRRAAHRPGGRRLLRLRHGRRGAGHPGLAGGRRGGRGPAGHRLHLAGPAGLVAGPPQAPRGGAADRSRPVQLEAVPHRDQRADDAADRPGRPDDRAAHLPADGPGVHARWGPG